MALHDQCGELEQVHVRGMIYRGVRLELITGLGLALAVSALPQVAWGAHSVTTQTALNVDTQEQGARPQAKVAVTVTGDDGLPATGAVSIREGARQLGSLLLDGEGQASAVFGMPGGGNHILSAVYTGDARHLGSVSPEITAQGPAVTTPDFQVTVGALSPASTLTAGGAGTAIVTVTPVSNASLAAPMFVTLSCSGLPNQASCNFTPSNIEVLATTPTSCPSGSPAASCPPTSSMVVLTSAASAMASPASRPGNDHNAITWAFLLPGALGLGGLAWGTRRNRWMNRLVLVALVAFVTMLGATGCNPQYYYYHHGPGSNPATPSGTYTIYVTGQSSDGVTAITHSSSFTLTVN